jgi:hypothetical protein
MRKLFSLIFLSFSLQAAALQKVPDGYFRSPVDIKMYLSGTFGEPRSTHFHTGIDIKTEGVEGKSIYAVADGYVSRISVSPYGYGNALYITHDNGLVSVYGHLQKFSSEIQSWVKNQQRLQTDFAINIENIDPNLFKLKKGQVVARSGNSGGSGGPHLHFEIRDSLEHPLNPLNYGFSDWLIDAATPSIYNVFFYNLDENKSFSSSEKQKVSFVSTGIYKLSQPVIVNTEVLGLGVHTVDLFTGTSNKNGIYKIKMYKDDALYYHYQIDELSFDVTKHVYTHCDYSEKRNNNTVHKCFIERGNRLPTYPFANNQGKIYLLDNDLHAIRIEVSDFHGNTSSVNFQVQKSLTSNYFIINKFDYSDFFLYGKRNYFQNENIKIELKEEVLFDDLYFKFSEKPNNKLGPFLYVHDVKTPLSNYFDIALKLHEFDPILSDKYLVAFFDYNHRKKALGGKIRDGFIHTQTKEFGTYFIDIDTIAPIISALNISEGKSMSNQKLIQFKADDNLSGIKEYNAFINGSWVVLAYDAKRNLFSYEIDELTFKGDNEIEIIIADERGNASKKSYKFLY